jgi:hypothetical protein
VYTLVSFSQYKPCLHWQGITHRKVRISKMAQVQTLVTKWHNQQVGDSVRQEWLYKTENGYRIDYYSGEMGGKEWSENLTDSEAKRAAECHRKDQSYH